MELLAALGFARRLNKKEARDTAGEMRGPRSGAFELVVVKG